MELEGVEPSSARGNHTLSTRLFQTGFSCRNKTWTTKLRPYPLNLHRAAGARRDYFRFTCAALSSDSEPHPWGDVSFLRLAEELSHVVYCASTRLREHTRCCQLIFRPQRLWSLQSPLRVLTYHLISPSNPVNPISDEDLPVARYFAFLRLGWCKGTVIICKRKMF